MNKSEQNMTDLSTHIIKIKKLIGGLETLLACPTNQDLTAINNRLTDLDTEVQATLIECNRLKFEENNK